MSPWQRRIDRLPLPLYAAVCVGPFTMLAILVAIVFALGGCAHLATVQRETAALVLAAQQTREACEAEPEPRPEVCKAVDRLLAEIEPYVEVAEGGQ